jgi:hypothetical protein
MASRGLSRFATKSSVRIRAGKPAERSTPVRPSRPREDLLRSQTRGRLTRPTCRPFGAAPAREPDQHRIVFVSAEDGKAVSSLLLGPGGGRSKPTEGGGWTEPTQRSEEDEPDVDQAAACGVKS